MVSVFCDDYISKKYTNLQTMPDCLPFIGGVLNDDWDVINPLSTIFFDSIEPVGVTASSSFSFFTISSDAPKAFFTSSSCFKSVKIMKHK